MQRHRYSLTGALPALVLLALTLAYSFMAEDPSFFPIIIGLLASLIIWKKLDALRNIEFRNDRRQLMREALAQVEDFDADETYKTEYNGLMLQIDNTRKELLFIDQKLDLHRIHFKELTEVYNVVGGAEKYNSSGSSSFGRLATGFAVGSMFGPLGTLAGIGWGRSGGSSTGYAKQAALFVRTSVPDKEEIPFLYFDAWHSTTRTVTMVPYDDERLLKAREEMKPVYERLHKIVRKNEKKRAKKNKKDKNQ